MFSAIRAGIRYARYAPALTSGADSDRPIRFVRQRAVGPFPVLGPSSSFGLDSIKYGILFGYLRPPAQCWERLSCLSCGVGSPTDSLAGSGTILFAAATAA